MDSRELRESFRRVGMGGWVSLVVGIKERTNCMEHWVLYANNE